MGYFKMPLIKLVKSLCYQEGEFTLASGKTSNHFVDLSKLALTCDGLNELVSCVQAKLNFDCKRGLESFDAVGGPVLGAVPIISGLVMRGGKRGFFVRSEPKKNSPELIEGVVNPGDRVLMVEDVTTTGGSLLKAIKAVQARGVKVELALTIVDRQDGATEALAAAGVRLDSLLLLTDLAQQSI